MSVMELGGKEAVGTGSFGVTPEGSSCSELVLPETGSHFSWNPHTPYGPYPSVRLLQCCRATPRGSLENAELTYGPVDVGHVHIHKHETEEFWFK